MRTRTLTLLTCAVWFTISTAQIPTLLKDINPTGNSNASGFACFGGVTYFSATDGVNGTELWKTDGTEAGTVMVKDINTGTGGSFPRDFMPMNGLVYFIVNGVANVPVLWRTDGTESGTQLALNHTDVTGLLEWIAFAAFPGSGLGGSDRIFFRGLDEDHGRELWSTDGTAAGTALFMDINPGPTNGSPDDPVAFEGKLYFKGFTDPTGQEPWISDGTVAGTHILADIVPDIYSSSPTNFFPAAGLVFFRAGTGATGEEVFATDGTEAGTGLVKDIYLGTGTSLPGYFAEHNGLFYFRAYPDNGVNYIYQSDGTLAGTVALPAASPFYESATSLCSHGGWLYYNAYDGVSRQLWRTDGTAAGTTQILYPGSDVPNPLSSGAHVVSCNGDMLFSATYMAATGIELYSLSLPTGTEEHTEDIIQLYPNPVADQLRMTGIPSGSTLSLFTLDGRLALSGPSQPQMSIRELGAGVYLARVADADGRSIHTQSLMIER